MAEIKELMSKLLLRNDSKENWESENPVLMKGEAGIEFIPGVTDESGVTEDSKINIKIGDGLTNWNDLPYALNVADILAQIPDVDLSTVTNNVQVVTAYDALVDGKAIGDIGIVKAPLYEGAETNSYTAYVWNGTAWSAMDGNYTAENVFTSKKITLAGDYTSIGNYSKGDEINAGTSIQTLLSGLLQTTLQPSVTQPSASISASGDDGNKEVGTSYTLPTATLTVKTGSYTYNDTGVSFDTGDVVIAYGADPDAEGAFTKTNGSALTNNGTVSIGPGVYSADATTALYTDSQVSYTFSGKAAHGDGVVAQDNLGGASDPVKQITAGDVTVADKTVSYRGFRKMFCGCSSDSLTSAVIRDLSLKSAKASTTAFEVTAPVGATNLIVAAPTASCGKNYTLSKAEMFTMSYEDYTGMFETKDQVAVADARGGENGLQNYNIYVYSFAALKAATKFRITLK